MKRVLSDGVEIAFEDTGHGEPALVLIHGAFGSRAHVAPLVAHLAERHRVIALDLRGHGESGVPRDGFRIADFAQDVLAVCREARVERAVLCGHSMAGAVALTAAALDPGLAAGVVLLDTVLFPDPLQRQARETLVRALEGPHWLEALRGFIGARMFSPFDPPELQPRIIEELAGVPPHIPAPLFRDFFNLDVSSELSAGRYPLLFIYHRIPADVERRLRELRPDVLIGSVVGSGHYITLVVPEQVSAMLDRFLAILPLAVAA
jgi:pimeloyl-ACP methyl ester carboxylesterase